VTVDLDTIGRISVVGPCASGKSTIVRALRMHGYDAHVTSQEHSAVPDLWKRQEPAVLIALQADLESVRLRRRNPRWSRAVWLSRMPVKGSWPRSWGGGFPRAWRSKPAAPNLGSSRSQRLLLLLPLICQHHSFPHDWRMQLARTLSCARDVGIKPGKPWTPQQRKKVASCVARKTLGKK